MANKTTIPKRLKAIRKKNGNISAYAFAPLIGYTPNHYYILEREEDAAPPNKQFLLLLDYIDLYGIEPLRNANAQNQKAIS